MFEHQPLFDDPREIARSVGSRGTRASNAACEPAKWRSDAADRRPRLSAGRVGLRRGFLAKKAYELGWRHSRALQHPRHTVPRRRVRARDRRTSHRLLRQPGRLPRLGHGRPGDVTSTATRRISLARSPSAASWWSYGDVGQTFLYGAKGGEFYVMGNAAGRPMINAVGKAAGRHQRHRAGLPGRVVHGRRSAQRRRFRHHQRRAVRRRERQRRARWICRTPEATCFRWPPGGRSTSAIRKRTLVDEQLNAGALYQPLSTDADWKLILPYLQRERAALRHSDPTEICLTVDGHVVRAPRRRVSQKVIPDQGCRDRRRKWKEWVIEPFSRRACPPCGCL